MSEVDNSLKRGISLPFLIFYGLGTMIGGGIYALTGEVAGVAGMQAPIAFGVSALLALITAFSYAELSVRFPFSAGEVRYVDAAFKRKMFSSLIGWFIVFTGIVSAGALAHATAGFIGDFVELPLLPVALAIVVTLGLVAAWGITESVALVAIITLIEILGLLMIIYTGRHGLAEMPARWHEFVPRQGWGDLVAWGGIFGAAFLAFYAFIGFEDMVNVVEEVQDAERTMPLAIIVCILLTLIIYVCVSFVAVLSVPPDVLAQSNTPMATIVVHNGGAVPPWVMGLISLLATVNGVLVQLIMGSRVLYGMAKGGEAPSYFGAVNTKTQTPLLATGFVIMVALAFVLFSDLTTLAHIASAIILFVFTAVNAALLRLKWAGRSEVQKTFSVPFVVPLSGALVCSAMLLFMLFSKL